MDNDLQVKLLLRVKVDDSKVDDNRASYYYYILLLL